MKELDIETLKKIAKTDWIRATAARMQQEGDKGSSWENVRHIIRGQRPDTQNKWVWVRLNELINETIFGKQEEADCLDNLTAHQKLQRIAKAKFGGDKSKAMSYCIEQFYQEMAAKAVA